MGQYKYVEVVVRLYGDDVLGDNNVESLPALCDLIRDATVREILNRRSWRVPPNPAGNAEQFVNELEVDVVRTAP